MGQEIRLLADLEGGCKVITLIFTMIYVPQALLGWKQPCLVQLCQAREMLQRQHPDQRVNGFLRSRAPTQHYRRVVERWDT